VLPPDAIKRKAVVDLTTSQQTLPCLPRLFAGALKAVGAISPGNALDRGRMAFRFLTRYRARKNKCQSRGRENRSCQDIGPVIKSSFISIALT
jgi:hypothetical protein